MKKLIVLLVLLLAACAGPASGSARWSYADGHIDIDIVTDTPVPTETLTPTLTATSLPTLTETPTLTATSTPTLTGTPTLTATPPPTATDQPTATPTATIAPTMPPTPTETIVALPGVPFGAFHNSDFSRTYFNGAILSHPEFAQLQAARDAGYKVIFNAGMSDPCHYLAGGADTYDVDRHLADIQAAINDHAAPFIADGTIIGIMELNEPHDPNGCDPIPVYKLEQVAAGFKALYPDLLLGFGTHPGYWAAGCTDSGRDAVCDLTDVDFLFAQHSANKGELSSWLPAELEVATRNGWRLVLSANLYNLGASAAVSAAIEMCAVPDVLMVSLWTDRFVDDADGPLYRAALEACQR